MNNIPVYSGLGSSATAIVGGLLAASALRKKPLEKEELLDLAATIEGHPDNVAPAIFGGFVASAVADSGRVEAVTLPVPPEVRIVVAVPRLKLETRESRGLLPVSVSMESATYNLSRTALWVAAVARGELEMLRTATRDALHQDSRSKLVPGFRSVLQAAMEAGALGAALSGSGPSVVAFARESSTDTVRDAMRAGFSRAGVDTRVLVTRPAPTGARLILPDISDKP